MLTVFWGPAASVDFQAVIIQIKAVITGDFFLEFFNGFAFKFENGSALNADQVIVVLPVEVAFVAKRPVSEIMFLGNLAFLQEFQGSVYGGIADLGVVAANAMEEFFGIDMPFAAKKMAENIHALGGQFQIVLAKIILKYLTGLAQFFAVILHGREC